MTNDNAESTRGLLKDQRQRQKETRTLEMLFEKRTDTPWNKNGSEHLEPNADLADNHPLKHVDQLINERSAPMQQCVCRTVKSRHNDDGRLESRRGEQCYFYEATMQTGQFHRANTMHKFLPSKLLSLKNKHNLRNLFEASHNANLAKQSSNAGFDTNDKKKETQKGVKLFTNIAYDFLSLAILGISMAIVSLLMDLAIEKLGTLHLMWMKSIQQSGEGVWETITAYFVWVLFSVSLILFCAIFVHYVSPQAIGSGIPEMKTVLRGVILKEYLSFRTMISKIVGLTVSLGSGMPIGKEGPFVHIASVMANLLSKFLNTFDSVYINESRHSEMLAVGCATGVACVFSAPVGGVLFSIEATSVYFAVRNYWRGFFAATCSATVFRLCRVAITKEITVTAYFQTHFPKEAFFPEELPIFAIIGLVCGLGAASFIVLHRKMVLFLRSKNALKVFKKHCFIYPTIVSLLISSLTYSHGFGQLLGGERKFGQSAKDFFQNCTWSAPINTSQYCEHSEFLSNWTGINGDLSIFLVLSCFIVVYFFLVILASTLPIPAGTFGPSFTLGAAFGRLVGELIFYIFPQGVREDQMEVQVYPGVYAVVGAAAFCGGITHTISVAVIIFELTGQLVCLLPVMIAVLIANAVCSYLQPSIYDSIIQIKHLPFLPDIPNSSSTFYGIKVEQFMTANVKFLTPQTTYEELQKLLTAQPHLKAFPVVENNETMVLLGSSSRRRLLDSLDSKVGSRARQFEAFVRLSESFDEVGRRFRLIDNEELRTAKTNEKEQSLTADFKPDTKSDLARKIRFYYNDLPSNQLDPSKLESNTEKLKKVSRFTVISVPDVSPQSSCVYCSQSQSRPSSQMSGSEDGNDKIKQLDNRKRNGTFASNVVQNLTDAITQFNNGINSSRRRFDAEVDLHGTDRTTWEKEQLAQTLDLAQIGVDSAPFQLTSNTSLLKVHSLFSLIGLNRAYVTKHGRLVGVVALRDIRVAIEMIQQNKFSIINDENLESKRLMSIKKTKDLTRKAYFHPPLEEINRTPTPISFCEDDSQSFTSLSKNNRSLALLVPQ